MLLRLFGSILTVLSLIVGLGCERDASVKEEAAVVMSYEYAGVCPTGLHEFSGDDELVVRRQMCEALINEELNGYCAYNLRMAKFNEECGEFSDLNPSNYDSFQTEAPDRTDVIKSYRFYDEVQGCETGYHEFASLLEETNRKRMCRELKTDLSNRNCARDQREAYFRENCPDMVWN